ncbi:hypothetical protein NLG97_g8224 [Lecanicillium saksenae]|uniref:Uncharacterized protein n=1 Tax=Lecanicillium saksenae TaxID=468837 RepID=A0ACC1QM54_9HYPO|nr:hypothetical protein NLG97_g8224 [Lecanicillium saksenae]
MTTANNEVEEFLRAHPQLLVGRAAWEEASNAISDYDTFYAISKPFPSMVVYQKICSKSNRVIVAAALISDERAEAHYQRIAKPQAKGCVCPEGDCSEWQLRCYACAWANDESCATQVAGICICTKLKALLVKRIPPSLCKSKVSELLLCLGTRTCDEAQAELGPKSPNRLHHMPSPDDSSGEKPLRPILPVPKLQPVEPPDWEFMEAGRYLPLLSHTKNANNPKQALLAPELFQLSRVVSRNNFIMTITLHRISSISALHGVPVRPGELPVTGHLWKKVYRYLAKGVADLNNNIQSNAPVVKIMAGISTLLGSEMMINDSIWRAHLQGVTAFLEKCGGIDTYLREAPPGHRAVQFCCVLGILANTTSPAHDQLLGFHRLSDEQVLRVYSIHFFNLLACPSPLFIELQRITRLRLAVFQIPGSEITSLVPIAMGIAKRLAYFSPDHWTETYDIPSGPARSLLARLFKDAITMYAVLSLPPVLGGLFGPGHELGGKQRVELRERLLEGMEEANRTYRRFDSLFWIVAVLGVALHDGTKEDKRRVISMIEWIMEKPTYTGPLTLLNLLKLFWSLGDPTWDGCFYEPTHVMA